MKIDIQPSRLGGRQADRSKRSFDVIVNSRPFVSVKAPKVADIIDKLLSGEIRVPAERKGNVVGQAIAERVFRGAHQAYESYRGGDGFGAKYFVDTVNHALWMEDLKVVFDE